MSPEIHEAARREAEIHLPDGYSIRSMASADDPEIAGICAAVYPAETPYTTAGWSAVIQWLNPECPTPPGFEITRLPRRSSTS